MGNLSSKKIKKLRIKQKFGLILKYLVALILITPIAYFAISKLTASKPSEDDVLGTEVEKTTQSEIFTICIDQYLDEALQNRLLNLKNSKLVSPYSNNDECSIKVMRKIFDSNQYSAIYKNIYVLAGRYDNKNSSITKSDISSALKSGYINDSPVMWAQEDQNFIYSLDSNSISYDNTQLETLMDSALNNSNLFLILPIDSLTPQLKLNKIDGRSPLQKDFYVYDYPLADVIWINSDAFSNYPAEVNEIKTVIKENSKYNDFEERKIASILLTGKSAVGARQYYNLDKNPLINLASEMQNSDITFVSNQSAFTDKCLQQNNSQYLCGKIKHFSWLKEAGVDIISVAGESIIDQERIAFSQTLALYKQNEITYVGGGVNIDDASKIVTTYLNEKGISFISTSLITPTRYLATKNLSGNIASDQYKGDAKNLLKLLNSAKSDSFKIAEFRWISSRDGTLNDSQEYYVDIARGTGADIIFGTSESKPGNVYIYEDVIVFNSLGNFLYSPDIKPEIHGYLVKLYFLEDKFISFELLPVESNESYILSFSDMDTEAKIMNTVYVK